MADVALILGGSAHVFDEFNRARDLCRSYGQSWNNFCCNDMIAAYPDLIHNAVTLHPEKLNSWLAERERAGYPPVTKIWAHRPAQAARRISIVQAAARVHPASEPITDNTADWGASVGGLGTKIAREEGYRKVILCGVPMTVEDGHFRRQQRWNAAHGFRRGWQRHIRELAPFVRSMSGWTLEQFGEPNGEWLLSNIPDPRPMRPNPVRLKA